MVEVVAVVQVTVLGSGGSSRVKVVEVVAVV